MTATFLILAFGSLPELMQTAPADPTGGLLSYGVLGIVVVALLTGLMVPGYLYKRTEAENDRLRALIDDKVYPTIETGTATTREAVEVMKEVVKLMTIIEQQQQRRDPRS